MNSYVRSCMECCRHWEAEQSQSAEMLLLKLGRYYSVTLRMVTERMAIQAVKADLETTAVFWAEALKTAAQSPAMLPGEANRAVEWAWEIVAVVAPW